MQQFFGSTLLKIFCWKLIDLELTKDISMVLKFSKHVEKNENKMETAIVLCKSIHKSTSLVDSTWTQSVNKWTVENKSAPTF